MIALNHHPLRREGILAQEAQGRTVLLRLQDGSYYALDEVGARIWELCDGQHSLEDIVAAVCAEFNAPSKTVTADLLEFVRELTAEQLLVEAS